MPPNAATPESIKQFSADVAKRDADTSELAAWVDKEVLGAVSKSLVLNLERSLGRELGVHVPVEPRDLAASRTLALALVDQAVDPPWRFSPREDGRPLLRRRLRMPPTVCSPRPSAATTEPSWHGLSKEQRLLAECADPELLNDARELQEQALKVAQESLGLHHRDTLGTMLELLRTLKYAQDWNAAESLAAAAVEVATAVHGPRHPMTWWLDSELRRLRTWRAE